jgi:hypothetical protein
MVTFAKNQNPKKGPCTILTEGFFYHHGVKMLMVLHHGNCFVPTCDYNMYLKPIMLHS